MSQMPILRAACSAPAVRAAMERLAQALTPDLTDPQTLTALVTEADAEGFDFDD